MTFLSDAQKHQGNAKTNTLLMIVEKGKETNLGMVDGGIVEEDQPFVGFHIRR